MNKKKSLKRRWGNFKHWLSGKANVNLTTGMYRGVILPLWIIASGIWFDIVANLVSKI